MKGNDIKEIIDDMRYEVVEELVSHHVPKNAYVQQWDIKGLSSEIKDIFNISLPVSEWADEEGIDEHDLIKRINESADEITRQRAQNFGSEIMTYAEKSIIIQTLDHFWQEHLVNLEHLRSVIGFRGYAQRDPLQEYKSESFDLFQNMLARMRTSITTRMMNFEVTHEEPPNSSLVNEILEGKNVDRNRNVVDNIENSFKKIGRNTPCACGSGKKYKHCHGKLA